MKKFLLLASAVFFVGFLTFLLQFNLALAQDNDNSSVRERTLENNQEGQQRREELQGRIATKTAQLRQEHIKRLQKVFNRILDRYEAALGRLEKIVGKLEKRMDKLAARGVDTTSARFALSNCQSKKTAAETAIVASRAKVDAIDPASATVRDTVKTAIDALRSAKREIRNYHKCLVEVTRMLKAAKPKEGTESAE